MFVLCRAWILVPLIPHGMISLLYQLFTTILLIPYYSLTNPFKIIDP